MKCLNYFYKKIPENFFYNKEENLYRILEIADFSNENSRRTFRNFEDRFPETFYPN